MSQAARNDFECLVAAYFQRYSTVLRLSEPTFDRDGFTVTATMAGTGGNVELRCGPAEYSAEIFIFTAKESKRWSLIDLLAISIVRTWMIQNRPHLADRSRLETEIDCAFSLLTGVLKDVPEFKWLARTH